MNTWTSGGHFPQHRFGTGAASSSRAAAAAHSPFRFALVSTKTSTNRFVFGGLTNRQCLATGAISSSRAAPTAASLLPPPFVSGGLTSRRRFASLRSGRFPSLESSVRVIALDRHPHCNPALLKKISCSSSSFPCFVSRFLLRFCLGLRRSLSSSSSQLNNTRPHSSVHPRPAEAQIVFKIHVSLSPSQILDVTDVTLNRIWCEQRSEGACYSIGRRKRTISG